MIRRESGVLKRLRATPLPGWAYITAVLGSIVFVFFLEALALIVLGRLAFDVALPDNAVSSWLRWLSAPSPSRRSVSV